MSRTDHPWSDDMAPLSLFLSESYRKEKDKENTLRASLEARNPARNPAISQGPKPKWKSATGQITPPFGSPREGDAVFLFLYFLKMFFIEIYFRFHILQFYTPTAWQEGGRGPTCK